MAKSSDKKSYDEIDDIKEDLSSLKSNIVALTKTIQDDGKKRAMEMNGRARDQVKIVQDRGQERLDGLDEKVREKPTQSLLMAFGAGLALSLLMGRRS